MRTIAARRLAGAIGLAATCALILAVPGASAPMPVAATWFDQPMTGSTHPMGPVTVTVHATDSAGVSAIHLWIDETVLEIATIAAPPPILASATFTWSPEATGQHLLTARGVGTTGTFGAPASILVTIGDVDASPEPSLTAHATPTQPSAMPSAAATMAPTPRPTTRPTPAPTAAPTAVPTPAPTAKATPRPTPVPCSPAPPELLAPVGGVQIRDPSLNPPTFRWAHRTPPACTPIGYRIQIFDDPDLGHLVLDVTLGNVGEWTPGSPLADCTTYFWRVATRAPGGTFGPWSAPASFELFIGRCV
ncbi:MAG: hypothetical protein IT341_07250 [Chloroflexi bacterium]|nr:hypothetical protein [Chloroflexota bacterium]